MIETVKLPPRGQYRRLPESATFCGPLKDCIRRNRPADEASFTRRWFRAQMRAWAGHWRDSHAQAAILGRPVESIASTYLWFARQYRDEGRRTQ